jgi:hypothetical protein
VNVVLLSTRKLAADYFDTLREDLGDPNVGLDVIAWVPPAAPITDTVQSFTLIGAGQMPVAAPTAAAAAEKSASQAGGVGRLLPGAIKRPVRLVRAGWAERALGKAFWGRLSGRRDVMATIEKADVVVALDSGAVWAGWNLGQRRASVPVVLGIPAARRELDQLKAPVGHG